MTVASPTKGVLAAIDRSWPDARRPSDVHRDWRWELISRACEDRFVIVAEAGEPVAIWGSKSASKITLQGTPYYRLDFIELRPGLRGQESLVATFALATVAMRAHERGARGVVLVSFNIPGLLKFYENRGAVLGAPKGWSHEPGLVPYSFDEPALERLERSIDELETTKGK